MHIWVFLCIKKTKDLKMSFLKRISWVYWLNNKAEFGVGSLVIFIALILVAAVTAGVLLQTSFALQQKSLVTGKQSTAQVATHIDALEISGVDGRTGNLTNFTMIMKLSPGSDPVVLDATILRMWDTTFADTYTYIDGPRAADEFNATFLQEGNLWVDGTIQRGDIVKLEWTAINTIHESQHLSLSFLPQYGSVTQISLDAPEVFGQLLVHLYP